MPQTHSDLFDIGCLSTFERWFHRRVTSDATHGVEERAPSRDARLINDLLRGHVPASCGKESRDGLGCLAAHRGIKRSQDIGHLCPGMGARRIRDEGAQELG
jgi:hypothetical protein